MLTLCLFPMYHSRVLAYPILVAVLFFTSHPYIQSKYSICNMFWYHCSTALYSVYYIHAPACTHTNILVFVQVVEDLWPIAKNATLWFIDYTNGTLPAYITPTYDTLGLNAYTYATYNGAFFLLAMRAAEELANYMGTFFNTTYVCLHVCTCTYTTLHHL